MNCTEESAPVAADALPFFQVHQMMTVLFDCPLWPAADATTHLLVSSMTRQSCDTHQLMAHMLCQRSLARQFPSLIRKRHKDQRNTTLREKLGAIANARRHELDEWLKELSSIAKPAGRAHLLNFDQQCELADSLDRLIVENSDRSIALRNWFTSLNLCLFHGAAGLEPSTLKPMLQRLDDAFRHCEEDARQVHSQWLETRRSVAGVPQQVQIQPLPVNTYTLEHRAVEVEWCSKYVEATHCLSQARAGWGRLEYFRREADRRPEIN